MSILGTVASLYMMILIILLIISFGLIGLKFVNYVLNMEDVNSKQRSNTSKPEANKAEASKWLKAALYSFLGLIISMLVLSILNSSTSFSLQM